MAHPNFGRFLSLPNGLKPAILTLIFIAIFVVSAAPTNADSSLSGGWFFWLNILAQLIWMVFVFGLFLYDAEEFLTYGRGRDSWPVLEVGYSAGGFLLNLMNTYLLASWQKYSINLSNMFTVAAFITLLLASCYGLGAIMMYRIWKGFVKSGAGQNPQANVQAGDVGSMHPGI